MTALKKEMIDYINWIPEEKLLALKPLFVMLSNEPATVLERLNDEDLTDEEREAFEKAELEFENGETIDFEEYLLSEGIELD